MYFEREDASVLEASQKTGLGLVFPSQASSQYRGPRPGRPTPCGPGPTMHHSGSLVYTTTAITQKPLACEVGMDMSPVAARSTYSQIGLPWFGVVYHASIEEIGGQVGEPHAGVLGTNLKTITRDVLDPPARVRWPVARPPSFICRGEVRVCACAGQPLVCIFHIHALNKFIRTFLDCDTRLGDRSLRGLLVKRPRRVDHNQFNPSTGFPGAFRAHICRPRPDVTAWRDNRGAGIGELPRAIEERHSFTSWTTNRTGRPSLPAGSACEQSAPIVIYLTFDLTGGGESTYSTTPSGLPRGRKTSWRARQGDRTLAGGAFTAR